MRSNDLTADWEAEQARPNAFVRLKMFLTRDVCFRTFLLFVLYGMGSWVTINGIFSELPIIVYQLPEGWNAASYLVLIVSASNIGPIIYILFQKWISLRVANVSVFLIGIISMCLLIRYWDSFTSIDNAQRSTGLWALSFTSAIADATTSVVFWPFIASFHHNYIPAIMLGEGFSGLIPAALTWIQNPNNDNVTIFSTELYWGLLAILLGIALTAFLFLDRIPNDSPERNKNEPDPGTLNPKSPRTSSTAAILLSDISKGAGENYATTAWNVLPNLLLLYWLGFCQNGVKPSILSFATIPMGQIAYQYSTNAGLCIDPIFALLTFFYAPSRGWIMALSVVWTGLLIYLLIAALQSPNQDMAGTQTGERVVIVISTICSALIAFTKTATIRRLQMIHTVASASAPPTSDGNPSLLKTLFTSDPYSSRLHRICVNGLLPTFLGVWIQFGSICGALIFYYLVNHTHYFSSGY